MLHDKTSYYSYLHSSLFLDNFILNNVGQTRQRIIQAFSSPSTVLRVSGDDHLSLKDGASDVMVLPPDNNTGVMLYIEVDNNNVRIILLATHSTQVFGIS